jgi:hypothetical protein
MTETQQTDASYNNIMAAIAELKSEIAELKSASMVQHEQIIFRIENGLINRSSTVTKKPVVKKVKGGSAPKKETAKTVTFANTLYWWIHMYIHNDQSISDVASKKETADAVEKMGEIAFAPQSSEYERALASALWKVFSKQKRTGELKTKYENWKKEQAKDQAEDIVVDPNSDADTDAH